MPMIPAVDYATAIANVRQAKQLLNDAGVAVESYRIDMSRELKRLSLDLALTTLNPSEADDLIRCLLWPEKVA